MCESFKTLADSKSGFLVGDSMTVADISLFEVFLVMEEFIPEGFEGRPKCKVMCTVSIKFEMFFFFLLLNCVLI